jgi:hypothetical protein
MAQPYSQIPLKITQLQEDPAPSNTGWMVYVRDGQTYKVQVNALLNVSGVPTSRVVAAGTGLTGGGALSSNITISVAPGGIGGTELNTTGVTPGVYGDSANYPVFTVDANGRVTTATELALPSVAGFVPTSRQVIAGTGLTGGGTLTSDVALSAALSNATPLSVGAAAAGTSSTMSRADHVHPSINLSDTTQTNGVLSPTRGGTGTALTAPANGGIAYSDGSSILVSSAGSYGQVLGSTGAGAPGWFDVDINSPVAANLVKAGPVSGASAIPTYRSLVNDDLQYDSLTINGTLVTLGGSGTVTAAVPYALTIGSGLSGTSYNGSSAVTITNTAPDQTVVLTGAGTVAVTGTYPNFTLTGSGGSGTVTSVGGTGAVSGISLSGTVTSSGNLTLGGALDLSSPPAIGNTTPNTGAFTSVTTPSVTASTTDLTLSAISTGVVNVNTLAGKAFSVTDHPFTAGGANVNFTRVFGGQTGYSTGIMAQGTDTAVVLAQSSKGASAVQFFTSSFGAQQFNIAHTASAVNYVQVTGGATGLRPTITAQGSDGAIGLGLYTKGASNVDFRSNAGSNNQFVINGGVSAVNYLQVAGSVAGNATPLSAQGSDTNISMAFQPKGTGAIDLAAGSSGVNISNGGTVTAITRTVAGTGYTSPPTVAITAPTTAGGVQATASTFLQLATTPTITSGGTGYTVNDVLTFVGGTIGLGTNAAQVTVTTVSSGVITGISIARFGDGYSVVPTNPISVTGGSGSGATFTVSGWQISGFTITNAGSGYIEQPTVTFSGGGGSGASAYASVGSPAVFKGLAGSGSSSFAFFSPAGEALRIHDVGGSAVNFLRVQGGVTGNTPVLLAAGSDTNVTLALRTQGTGSVSFQTGGVTQALVTHTASAVNYVQVTGSATAGTPTISVQGSDANANLSLASKGSGIVFIGGQSSATSSTVRLSPSGGNAFFASGTNTSVNYLMASGAATGSSPQLIARGTDTNIGVRIGSLNAGNVDFLASGDPNAGTGVLQMRVAPTASAVNYVQVTGAATGNPPRISAQGSDATIAMQYSAKGWTNHEFFSQNFANKQFQIQQTTASPVNSLLVTATATGVAPFIGVQGTDTNIDLALTPKGTGVVVVNGTVRPTALTASQAVFTDASDNLVSVALTGTGNVVLSTSPTLVTPVLGTPSSGTLTNCTGLPIGGITATGTPSITTYLRGDGSWATVSGGSGTVTSITAGTGLSGGTITTSGTIAIDSTVATLTGIQTLTNKSISGSTNTLSSIANSSLTNSAITINGTSTSLGGSISVGTVTSVGGTGTVSGLTLTGTVTTTGNLTLGGTLAVTPSNFASQTANRFLAAPNGAAGVPTFRAVVAADIPTLNQNTTGSAATFTSTTQNSQFNSLGVGTAGSATAGEIRATNNVTAFYVSDIKFKTNVSTITSALDKVVAIGGKEFDWTDEYIAAHGGEDGYFIRKHDFGVIAQDVQSVFPLATRTKPDGTLAVDYEKMCALAFQAIKELKAEIDLLKGVK